MGVYAVIGGSHGIGAKTVELLKKEGHEVINIDLVTCSHHLANA
jgi:NAD(P)-dependent dehydrogenase (short-subunit alcohol dehydrogenase family)